MFRVHSSSTMSAKKIEGIKNSFKLNNPEMIIKFHLILFVLEGCASFFVLISSFKLTLLFPTKNMHKTKTLELNALLFFQED